MDDNLFDEWSGGVSLANSNFFEEHEPAGQPLELNNPANYKVDPESIPSFITPALADPVVPAQPVQVQVAEADEPEVINIDGGGTVTIEKTSRGWKATLDSEEPNTAIENFYGDNKTKLIANLAKGKLQANKAIYKLKKEKLLGGDEPKPASNHSETA